MAFWTLGLFGLETGWLGRTGGEAVAILGFGSQGRSLAHAATPTGFALVTIVHAQTPADGASAENPVSAANEAADPAINPDPVPELAPALAPPSGAERPWFAVCVSSLDRLLADVDVLLGTINREELSDVFAERYRQLRDFPGMDRTRPFGTFWGWRPNDPATDLDETHEDILFLPIRDRDQLMKTVTFDSVDYREVAPGHFEIARPVFPYHALALGDYLWMGDWPVTMRSFANRQAAITRELAGQYDVALAFDLKQIPEPLKRQLIEQTRAQIEPYWQPQDGEAPLVAAWRRLVGQAAVDFLAATALDTERVVGGFSIDPQQQTAVVEATLHFTPRSASAEAAGEWGRRRTALAALETPEPFASGYWHFRLPTILPALKSTGTSVAPSADDAGRGAAPGPARPSERAGTPMERPREWSDAALAWQVFGDPYAIRYAVVALQVPGLVELAKLVPSVAPDERAIAGIRFRRAVPLAPPGWLKRFTGWNPVVWLGTDSETVWLGYGPGLTVDQALEKALLATKGRVGGDAARAETSGPETTTAENTGVRSSGTVPTVLSARFSARDLVGYLAVFDPQWADEQLRKGQDRVRIQVTAKPGSVTIRLHLETGVLRLLGQALAEDLAAELNEVLSR